MTQRPGRAPRGPSAVPPPPESPPPWTRADWIMLGALAAAMVALRLPYSLRPDVFFNADFAIVGLMGHHIRHGEWWTFYWGQNTHGTFAAAVTAAVLGVTGWPLLRALQVPPLLFQAAHVAVAYGFTRDLLGRREALLYAALTLLPTRFFLMFTVRTSPNYLEVLTLGLAALWVVLRIHRSEDRAAGRFFLWGALTGFGMWCLMYTVEFVVVAAAFLVLRWRLRHRDAGWHHLVGRAHLAHWWRRGAEWWPIGWVVGYAPVLVHLARGGQVESQLGLAGPAAMLAHLQIGLRGQVSHFVHPPPGWPAGDTIAAVVAYALAVLALAWAGVGWWRASWRSGRLADPLLFWLLLPVSWGLFVVSANTPYGAERYLWPYQLMLPLAVVALGRLLAGGLPAGARRRWAPAAVAAVFALQHLAVAAADFRGRPPTAHAEVLAWLRAEGLAAGFADYWVSYVLTLLADERLVVAPVSTLDRFPAYTRFALAQPRAALILRDKDAGHEARQFTIGGQAYVQRGEARQIGPYTVKLIERP